MSLLHDALSGRFYRLDTALEAGSLLEAARPYAFQPSSDAVAFRSGWCRRDTPYSGEIVEESSDLAYDDAGTGVWLLWLREEERSVSRKTVDIRASVRSSTVWGTEFDKLSSDMQEELRSEVRRDLLQASVPKTRIVPVVLTSSWAWIGRKVLDGMYPNKIFPLVGRSSVDPVAWSGEEYGWGALSTAALMAYLDSEDGFLDADVELKEVNVRGEQFRCRSDRADKDVRDALGRLVRMPSTEVKSLSFEVHHNGESVWVDLDAAGLFRSRPASSVGGLLHEQILRRFGDARGAAERVGEVMVEAYRKRSEVSP